MDAKKTNKIFLNSKKFFFLCIVFLGMIVISFLNIEKSFANYLILIVLLSLSFSGMYITSCSLSIDLTESVITYHRLLGLLKPIILNLHNLKEFQYKEDTTGRLTNFILVFPNKKLQITRFNTNFSQGINYLKAQYPNIPIRKIKY